MTAQQAPAAAPLAKGTRVHYRRYPDITGVVTYGNNDEYMVRWDSSPLEIDGYSAAELIPTGDTK